MSVNRIFKISEKKPYITYLVDKSTIAYQSNTNTSNIDVAKHPSSTPLSSTWGSWLWKRSNPLLHDAMHSNALPIVGADVKIDNTIFFDCNQSRPPERLLFVAKVKQFVQATLGVQWRLFFTYRCVVVCRVISYPYRPCFCCFDFSKPIGWLYSLDCFVENKFIWLNTTEIYMLFCATRNWESAKWTEQQHNTEIRAVSDKLQSHIVFRFKAWGLFTWHKHTLWTCLPKHNNIEAAAAAACARVTRRNAMQVNKTDVEVWCTCQATCRHAASARLYEEKQRNVKKEATTLSDRVGSGLSLKCIYSFTKLELEPNPC